MARINYSFKGLCDSLLRPSNITHFLLSNQLMHPAYLFIYWILGILINKCHELSTDFQRNSNWKAAFPLQKSGTKGWWALNWAAWTGDLSGRPWHIPATNPITSAPCSAAGHHNFSTHICLGVWSHLISLISQTFIKPYKNKLSGNKANRCLRKSDLQFWSHALVLPQVSSSCWHCSSLWF